jgi:hypothetical protein
MAKKEVIYQGLSELEVIIDDTSANSPDYFRVTNLPGEFTAGINIFKFKGNPSLFPENSPVYIEVLDANGLPVYYEIGIDLESQEQSAIISVYINEDTAPGNGSITICGQANQSSIGQILDASDINVRWTTPVYIDISKRNTDEIIFDSLPKVTITATTGSYTNLVYNANIRTYNDNWLNVQYIYKNGEAILYTSSLSSPAFPATATNTQISINYGNIQDVNQRTDKEISTSAVFTSSISAYSGNGIAYLTDPILFAINNSSEQHLVQSAIINDMTVVYEQSASLPPQTTQNTHNIAVVQFSGLQPQVGEVSKIRSYYKSAGVREYIFSNETDISKLANEFGFTSDIVTASFSLPTIHRNDRFDFKFEFVNPSGYVSKQVIEFRDVLFEGGNTYIGGDDNLMTGSLFVAGATGTGVQISGKGNAAMIRSIGYEGFAKAVAGTGRGGFVIYSGSVQPLLNASENYSGVGIELFANTSSYFKYTTSGSGMLDIRTNTFFLGNPSSSYIAGDPAGISISSSNFSLNQSGNITMTGNVNANTGIFGNVNVIGTVITGSIQLAVPDGFPPVSIEEYLIEPWFTSSILVFTGSVIRPVSSSTSDFVSKGLFNWQSSVNGIPATIPGGITGSRYGSLSTIDGYAGSLPKYFDKWGSIIGRYKIPEYDIVESGSWTTTLDNAIFQVSASNTLSLASNVITVPTSLLSADNLEPLELQVAARFIKPGISAEWIEASDNKFTVEIINIGGVVVVESSQYQTDAEEWLTFNIPISPGLFTHPVITYTGGGGGGGGLGKPIKSYNKFYIKLSWSSTPNPDGGLHPSQIRISELRIVRLAKSLGLKTSAIQFDSTFFSSTPISTEHFGSINPTEDNHSDLGSYDITTLNGFHNHIDQKRWRSIFAVNLYATDTNLRGSIFAGKVPETDETGGYFSVANSTVAPPGDPNYSQIDFYSVSDIDTDQFGKARFTADAESGISLQANSYNNTNSSRIDITKGDLYTYNSTTRLNAASSFKITSPTVEITGSLNIKDILQLDRRTTTPTPVEGMIIASGSAGSSKLYYYNGSSWNALF